MHVLRMVVLLDSTYATIALHAPSTVFTILPLLADNLLVEITLLYCSR
jgi:hypothetical protein